MSNPIGNDFCKFYYDISNKRNNLFIKLPHQGISYKDLVEKVNAFSLRTNVPIDTIQISYFNNVGIRLFSTVENQVPVEDSIEGIFELISWLNN